VTPEFCRRTISEVSAIQRDLKKRLGTRFALLGDEIYLKAGKNVPAKSHYGDYPQIEDGVGMVRSFANQFDSLIRSLRTRPGTVARRSETALSGTIMTGSLFAPVLAKMVGRLNEEFKSRLKVVAVRNDYFGGDVSVAGLLTGRDFLAARRQVSGDFAIVPRVALKSDEPVMLDGMHFEELQAQFDVPVMACDFSSFSALVKNGPEPIKKK
jgi:NifB/MoaA-like Fe-S oxidoreductase